MARVAIIAAGGRSTRTGLGQYTSKAALTVRGKTLLEHQLDFCRRSGVERVLVIARPVHARLLAGLLSPTEMRRVALIASDCASGWAGEVERARAFVSDDDDVLLLSCDNLHEGEAIWLDDGIESLFTYTTWDRDVPPTDGPVLACLPSKSRSALGAWVQTPSKNFFGDFFSGYAVVQGWVLFDALSKLAASPRGEKEITSLLGHLHAHSACMTVPYPGRYEDVRDLRTLALLDAGQDPFDVSAKVEIGAGVILTSGSGSVLLTERQDGRGWVPPGGLVEADEDYARAASRELREEVGVEISPERLRLLGVYPSLGKTGVAAASVIFHARMPQSARIRRAAEEVASYDWFATYPSDLTIPFGLGAAVKDALGGREIDARTALE